MMKTEDDEIVMLGDRSLPSSGIPCHCKKQHGCVDGGMRMVNTGSEVVAQYSITSFSTSYFDALGNVGNKAFSDGAVKMHQHRLLLTMLFQWELL